VEAPWHQRNRADQKEVLQEVGEDLIARIGQVTLVLPTSLVALGLLAHSRRGLLHEDLLTRIARFREFLAHEGAVEANSLAHASQAFQDAIMRFHRAGWIEPLDHQGARVWAIHVERRITLDFHKNQVLHFFAAAGYIAAAIRPLPNAPFTSADLHSRFTGLIWVLRREFVLDPKFSSSELLQSGLDALVVHGALARTGDAYTIADEEKIAEIYLLFRSLLEGYHLLAHRLPELIRRGLNEKEIPKSLQNEAANAVLLPESLSVVTLQNALSALKEEGIVEVLDSGKLQWNEPLREQRASWLAPMVR